ncbi:MAG: BT_3928 family protein [Flavobacteriales bacterium]
MKILTNIARIIVGGLFIFSGFVKLVDPIGFSYKLKEYFAADVLNLEFLIPFALIISIFVVVFEVILGVMILIGYAKKFTLWSLLAMMLFFTLLTFYTAYFNKVTDCGCFGDAVKLSPWGTFWKDVALIVLIILLFLGSKYIKPLFTLKIGRWLTFITFLLCMNLTYYVLMHLPIIDFRPYKIGTNLKEGMEFPENAAKPIFEYHWTFTHNGKEKEVITNGSFPNEKGTYTVETILVQEGYEPPIHDFTMERDGEDFSTQLLEEEKLIIVVSYSLSNSEKEGFIPIKNVTDQALKKGYKVIGLSASSQEVTEALADEYQLNFKFYFCDETALKTVIRSNPALIELNKGTVMQKLNWHDAEDLKLQ